MKVDTALDQRVGDPTAAAASARSAAQAGYDRVCSAETDHDPFLPIALAAGAADIELATNIAVAFARSPMTLAATAHDLQSLTGGRFVLGLGSQVKAHITRRFAMPWSRPAARMREYVLALQAIWTSWENGSRLNFEGEFYAHTLSSPLFDPGPSGYGVPPVFVAAVGPRMTEVVGEVADGLLCHAFTTPSYLAEVTVPALRRGMARAGRSDATVEIALPIFLVTGRRGADLSADLERVRRQIAFYGSTPAYRGVLDHHGWSGLHEELHVLSLAQRWEEMTPLIDDEVVRTIAVVADAGSLAAELRRRYGGLVDTVRLAVPYVDDPDTWLPVIADLRQPA